MKRLCLLLVLCQACGDATVAAPDDADVAGDGGPTLVDAASASDDASAITDGGAVEDGGVVADAGPHFDPAHAPSTLGSFTTQGSTGCGSGTAGYKSVSLTVATATRTGNVFIPANYDPHLAYPVVFVFHGDGGTGNGIRGGLNLETAANGKAIFVYPDGAGATWNDTEVNTNHDMDFVIALRASLRTQYCVDMKRTYLTGHSRGGYFVNQLACKYGLAEFAAIAPLSSTMGTDDNNAYVYGPPKATGPFLENGNWDFMCPVDGVPPASNPPLPKLPPPVIVMHGQCDNTQGVTFAEGRAVAEHWAFAARCTSTPAVVTNANQTCNTTCPTTSVDPCYTTPGCSSGHEVLFCAIPGMGHAVWCNAPARIWSFFAAH